MIFMRCLILMAVILLAGCGKKPEAKLKPEINAVHVRRECQFDQGYQSQKIELITNRVEYNMEISIKLSGLNRQALPQTAQAKIRTGNKESHNTLNLIMVETSDHHTSGRYYFTGSFKSLEISEMQIEFNITEGKHIFSYTLQCSPDMLQQIRSVL